MQNYLIASYDEAIVRAMREKKPPRFIVRSYEAL
jgi:hypothetical protein